ncbi:MAG: response regulator [Candidatus Rokubacteria bacterium]|nr:response regulator [Candidatus Rokubacteria bacterium]
MTASESSFDSPSAQRTVLVIEDNDDARAALVALLELEGLVVEGAADGQQGIDIARAKHPEIALIDIGLPGIDGYEVGRRIRALLGPRIFLVALTGYGQPEDRQRTVEAGFDAHLVKPVDPTDLTALLTRGTPGRGSPG